MYFPALFAVSLVASQASALYAREPVHQLQVRQASGIPTACDDICAPYLNATSTCTTFDCLCTQDTEDSLTGCLECDVEYNPEQGDLPAAQEVIEEFLGNCSAAGITTLSTDLVSLTTTITTLSTSSAIVTSASATTSSSQSTVIASTITTPSLPTTTGTATSTTTSTTATKSSAANRMDGSRELYALLGAAVAAVFAL